MSREAKPYPKHLQLAHERRRRYRRIVASPKQWAAIKAEKCDGGWCRVCKVRNWDLDAHHLVPRDRNGDDVAENIVGLCRECHEKVERREPRFVKTMLASLFDNEYAYAIDKGGEGVFERVYGIEYQRV